ncbi:MAG: hypothetical protein PHF88_02445 [Candidatus Pacebacteria bacterium]|nr:hypothetical protein [Candidatus Paceibacterota bacterium]
MKDNDFYEIDVPTLMEHLADLNENQIIEMLYKLQNLSVEDISKYLNFILEHLKSRNANKETISYMQEKIRKVNGEKWYSSMESVIPC